MVVTYEFDVWLCCIKQTGGESNNNNNKVAMTN